MSDFEENPNPEEEKEPEENNEYDGNLGQIPKTQEKQQYRNKNDLWDGVKNVNKG